MSDDLHMPLKFGEAGPEIQRLREENQHIRGAHEDCRAQWTQMATHNAEQAAEITRLRALCDRQSTALSLSGMRHGRILVGLERRNARQRRALAKLYQRRHDKNAALATARRDGMEKAAKIVINLSISTPSVIAAAIRAAALTGGKDE
jgi:hypothetical protein